VLVGVAFCSYATFSPFFANLNALVRSRFGFSIEQAGSLVALPNFTLAFLGPLIGYTSDRINRRGLTCKEKLSCLVIGAVIGLLLSQVIMASLEDCFQCNSIVYLLFLETFSYSLYICTNWATVS